MQWTVTTTVPINEFRSCALSIERNPSPGKNQTLKILQSKPIYFAYKIDIITSSSKRTCVQSFGGLQNNVSLTTCHNYFLLGEDVRCVHLALPVAVFLEVLSKSVLSRATNTTRAGCVQRDLDMPFSGRSSRNATKDEPWTSMRLEWSLGDQSPDQSETEWLCADVALTSTNVHARDSHQRPIRRSHTHLQWCVYGEVSEALASGPPFYEPPLRCYACKFSLFLVKTYYPLT